MASEGEIEVGEEFGEFKIAGINGESFDDFLFVVFKFPLVFEEVRFDEDTIKLFSCFFI
jgi:hypothetical protein